MAIAVWALAGFFALSGSTAGEGDPGIGAGTAASGAATGPSASNAGSQQAPSAAPAQIDTTACVTAVLAPKAFKGKPPSFDFICKQTNPIRGADEVKSRLVYAAKGALTPAMREWAALNWYEFAGFATLRARCCSSPPALKWPFKPPCPLDEAVAQLGQAVVDGEEAAAKEAIDLYGKHARCIARTLQAPRFKREGRPGSGQVTLGKLLTRARRLPRR